jgi:hypothetical protein
VAAAIALVNTALGLKAPLDSPALTGTPTAPTATAGTNTTQVASTGFVAAAIAVINTALGLKAPLASPALTGTPTVPTATAGTNTTQAASTAFVAAAVAALDNTNATFTGAAGAVVASTNVTSITRTGTGAYTILLTASKANTNYRVQLSVSNAVLLSYVITKRTNGFDIAFTDSAAAAADPTSVDFDLLG